MEIFLDEELIDVKLEGEKNAAEIVRGIDDWLDGRGIIIEAVSVNGVELADIKEAEPILIPDINRIEIFTVNPLPNTPKALREAVSAQKEALSGLNRNIDGIVANLQIGKDAQALEKINALCSVMGNIIILMNGISAMKNSGVDFSSIEFQGVTFENLSPELSSILSQMSGAMAKKDIVLLCDLIEYELSPRIETWLGLLDKIIAQLK